MSAQVIIIGIVYKCRYDVSLVQTFRLQGRKKRWIHKIHMKYEVLTVMNMKNTVFWYVTLCSLVIRVPD
jgi:hypothetical protein